MEKKYYFRGLGLGIIVTALIMGIALTHGEKREMTDSEVIARAKELGMTENTRLLEPSEADEEPKETEASAEEEQAKEPVKKDVAVAQPKDDAKQPPKNEEQEPAKAEPVAQENATSGNTTQNTKPQTGTNEMTKQDDDTGQTAPEEEPVQEEASTQQTAAGETSITIVSGDGSYTVAKKLETAGVIFSASSFDDFLCQNGYDKRLRTGTFRIPAGASDEEIAGIVTSQP